MSFSSRTPLSSRYICTCIALMDSSRARQPIMISREVGLLSRVSGLHSSRSTVVSDAHGINLRTIDIMIHDDCPVNVNSTITTYSMSCIPIRKPWCGQPSPVSVHSLTREVAHSRPWVSELYIPIQSTVVRVLPYRRYWHDSHNPVGDYWSCLVQDKERTNGNFHSFGIYSGYILSCMYVLGCLKFIQTCPSPWVF